MPFKVVTAHLAAVTLKRVFSVCEMGLHFIYDVYNLHDNLLLVGTVNEQSFTAASNFTVAFGSAPEAWRSLRPFSGASHQMVVRYLGGSALYIDSAAGAS